jgi:hypothetical protein
MGLTIFGIGIFAFLLIMVIIYMFILKESCTGFTDAFGVTGVVLLIVLASACIFSPYSVAQREDIPYQAVQLLEGATGCSDKDAVEAILRLREEESLTKETMIKYLNPKLSDERIKEVIDLLTEIDEAGDE